METESHDFFTLFLNTWLGSRPPSSIFKASILGQEATVDSYMMTSYESLTASATRINDLKAWNKKEKTKSKSLPAKAAAKKVKKIINEKAIAAKSIAKKPEPIIVETQPTRYVEATEFIESEDMSSTLEAEHTPFSFDEGNATTITDLKKNANPNAEDYSTGSDNPASLLAFNSKDNSLAENALAEINEQKKELLKIYRSTILTSTYKKIVYPSSAIDKNQQGKLY